MIQRKFRQENTGLFVEAHQIKISSKNLPVSTVRRKRSPRLLQIFFAVCCGAHLFLSTTALQPSTATNEGTATVSLLTSTSTISSTSLATTASSINIELSGGSVATCPCDCSTISEEECPLARYAPRGDCSCCKVCARQKSQTCDGLFMPCDRQFGLLCNQTTNTCEGKYDLRQATPPTHNALTLRWEPFLDGSVEPQSFYDILFVEASEFTDDLRKWNSTTSWSQRPVAQVSSGLQIATTYFFLTTIILNETKEVDYARRSEVIPLRTLGCRHNGQPYRVGEYFLEGCTYNCTCTIDGRWACYERKCPHFYKLGDIRDPRCTHVQDPAQSDDPCCVIYTCPNGYDSREDKCAYDGVAHELGTKFYTTNCTEKCFCDRLAIAQCEPFTSTSCEPPPVPDNRTCFAWQVATVPDRALGICCPTYKCVNEGVCVFDGIPYNNGDKVPSSGRGGGASTCDQQCECTESGRILCKSQCVEPDVPILSSNCPKMVLVNDTQTCCNKWMCSIGAGYCVKDNQMYALGKTWSDESCPIRKCHCQRSSSNNGNNNLDAEAPIAHTICETQCPHIAPSMLSTMSECLQPRIVEPEVDTCACPFVTCDPLYDEMTVNDLSYRVASPTAAEISFSLPDSLLAFLSASNALRGNFPQRSRNSTPFFAADALKNSVAAAESIKALDLVVAESHPNNGSLRHMHRLDLPYDSLLKERTSFTETAATNLPIEPQAPLRPKTTVVVRYVLQNLDPTMQYSVKTRLMLRDGVALPFSNTINITTTPSSANILPSSQLINLAALPATTATTTLTTRRTPPLLLPKSTLMTTRPYYSTAAIKLVQLRKTAAAVVPTVATMEQKSSCHVPVRGVIETFNDGDAIMRNCTHLCRCVSAAVECRYMCWTREYAQQMLQCNNVSPAPQQDAGFVEQPQPECCVQWRCADAQQQPPQQQQQQEEELVVISDGELTPPLPTTTTTTVSRTPQNCHSIDGQYSYRIGQTWRNYCNAMCLCATSGQIECDSYNPFCAELTPFVENSNYQQCSPVERLASCCPAFSCNSSVNNNKNFMIQTAISPGLLITLHLLRVDVRPGSHDSNETNSLWHTTARVRWNVAQDLVRQGAVIELVWRPLSTNQQQVDNNEAATFSRNSNTLTVLETHGEAEVLLSKQRIDRVVLPTSSSSSTSNDRALPQISPAAARRNAHAAYELVLRATFPPTANTNLQDVNSNYIIFSLPLVLDDLNAPSSTAARGTSLNSETTDNHLAVFELLTTTNYPVQSSTSTTSGIVKDFLFNTNGNGFPLGFLIIIIICVGILLCMLCVGCVRCVLVKKRGRRGANSLGSKASSTVSHIFQHGTVAAYAQPTTVAAAAAPQQQISRYGTPSTAANLNNVFHTVSQRSAAAAAVAAAAQASANHSQFYLKNSSFESSSEIVNDHPDLYGRTANTTIASIGSTVGSRLAALNHDRHRNGFTVVASAAALPVPLVAAPINSNGNKAKQQKTGTAENNKTKKKQHQQQQTAAAHTAGVYAVVPRQTTLTTNTASSSAMTTPNTSIPDLRSSLVYNKYASFDNLVFTGK